jgi:hypothetical protein
VGARLNALEMTDRPRTRHRSRSHAVRDAVGLGAVAVMGAAVGAVIGAAAEHRVAIAPPRVRRGARRAARVRVVMDQDGSALFV